MNECVQQSVPHSNGNLLFSLNYIMLGEFDFVKIGIFSENNKSEDWEAVKGIWDAGFAVKEMRDSS